MPAFRYLTNRISLPITTEKKKMEWQKNPFHSRKQQIPPTSHRAIENTNKAQNPQGQN
jgi:hypothetical protein